MVSQADADAASLIVGSVFAVLAFVYTYTLLYYDQNRRRRFASVIVHNIFVSALTALLNVWIVYGGDRSLRWIAYSFCSPTLLASAYAVLTKSRQEWNYERAYEAALLATFATVFSGFVLSAPGITLAAQWVVFAGAFVPFVAVPLLLRRAVSYYPRRSRVKRSVWVLLAVEGLSWLAYPLLFALSPVMTGTITQADAQLGYTLTDVVSKMLFDLGLAYLSRGKGKGGTPVRY